MFSIGELRKGIDLLAEGDPKRWALQSWLDQDICVRFAGRLLVFDDAAAERWGQVEVQVKRSRRTIPTVDAQTAAIALAHGLTLVTRNVEDFRATGVALINPWR